MAKTPQQLGFDFEEEFAGLLGSKVTPGSGNQWFAKMDIGDGHILWSLKHTIKDTLTVNQKLINEVENAAGAEGSMPGIAVKVAGEPFVMLRMEDFIKIVQEEIKIAPPSRSEIKRKNAATPLILRDMEEEE